jgi:hypothetical protein
MSYIVEYQETEKEYQSDYSEVVTKYERCSSIEEAAKFVTEQTVNGFSCFQFCSLYKLEWIDDSCDEFQSVSQPLQKKLFEQKYAYHDFIKLMEDIEKLDRNIRKEESTLKEYVLDFKPEVIEKKTKHIEKLKKDMNDKKDKLKEKYLICSLVLKEEIYQKYRRRECYEYIEEIIKGRNNE